MGQHDAATEPLAELAGKPVILVVEDELLVRIVEVDILREAGFRGAEALDADAAFELELLRRPPRGDARGRENLLEANAFDLFTSHVSLFTLRRPGARRRRGAIPRPRLARDSLPRA